MLCQCIRGRINDPAHNVLPRSEPSNTTPDVRSFPRLWRLASFAGDPRMILVWLRSGQSQQHPPFDQSHSCLPLLGCSTHRSKRSICCLLTSHHSETMRYTLEFGPCGSALGFAATRSPRIFSILYTITYSYSQHRGPGIDDLADRSSALGESSTRSPVACNRYTTLGLASVQELGSFQTRHAEQLQSRNLLGWSRGSCLALAALSIEDRVPQWHHEHTIRAPTCLDVYKLSSAWPCSLS